MPGIDLMAATWANGNPPPSDAERRTTSKRYAGTSATSESNASVNPLKTPNSRNATAIASTVSVLRSGLRASAAQTSHAYFTAYDFQRSHGERVGRIQ